MRTWTAKDRSRRYLAALAAFVLGLLPAGCADTSGEAAPESLAEATYELAAGCTPIASSSMSVTGAATSVDSGGACQSTNPPANSLDGSVSTRSSCEGIGSYLTFDLGSPYELCGIDIAWYLGDQRTNSFKIQASTDGATYTDILGPTTTSGTTTTLEGYTLSGTARYVRVFFLGNNVPDNDWMSVAEVKIGTARVQTLYPTADAYVRSGSYASQNFGTGTTMEVDTDNGGTITQSYVRFSIGNVGTISSAKLRFYVTNSSSSGPEIKKISDTAWGETTITWNNKPAVDGALMGTIGSASENSWVEIDVTSHVTASSVFSVALVPQSSDGMDVQTREASSGKPELVIVAGSASCNGNGICDGSETCSLCPNECTTGCSACNGNGTCDGSETCSLCPNECTTGCSTSCDNDGTCEPGETCSGCATDCASLCKYEATFENGCNYTYNTGCAPFVTDNVDSCEFEGICCSTGASSCTGSTVLDSLETLAHSPGTSPSRCTNRSVNKSLRVTVRPTDKDVTATTSDKRRAEVKDAGDSTLEEEYWYGISYYVPSTGFDNQDTSSSQVLLQWHTTSSQFPSGYDYGTVGNPIIGLRVTNGNWTVTRELKECDGCRQTLPLTGNTAVARDVWTDFVFRIRWSKSNTGYVEIWKRNGAGGTLEKIYAESGVQNMNSDVQRGGHYLKVGLYDASNTSTQTRVFYIDEVRYAKRSSTATYDTMKNLVDPEVNCVGGSGGGNGGGGGDFIGGTIAGVEQESHSHHPPMIDSGGNLYRITESNLSNGNRPRMMKSSDGGSTWSEVDSANRPTASDLEGGWQLQVGTSIYSAFTKDSTVWFEKFNTSDALSNPDRWQLQQTVDSSLSTSGVAQFTSLAHACEGQFWLFYSDKLSGSNQQIAYKRRDASGNWGTKVTVGSTSTSWTAPVSVVGENDVTHLFYKDHTNGQLYWRTLNCAGALSGAARIDSAGTHATEIPHTNAVYHDNAGQEVIVIAYANGAGVLKAITLVEGQAATESTISSAAVMVDPEPDIIDNMGTVAHLAVDGTTVHAVWSDAATGDLMYSKRAHGGSWTTPTTLWASGTKACWYVYSNIYTRAGSKRLAYTCDRGTHADDEGDIFYGEKALP